MGTCGIISAILRYLGTCKVGTPAQQHHSALCLPEYYSNVRKATADFQTSTPYINGKFTIAYVRLCKAPEIQG
jgi:hypothetical protein